MPAATAGNKRARGTGSIRQRRRGLWQIRWETGTGKSRLYHSETVRGTKTQAEAILREHLVKNERARSSGVLSTEPRLTVGQWLRHWLDHVARHNLRPGTFEGYQAIVERELIPALGTVRLNRLGIAEVQELVNSLRHRPHWARYQRSVLRSALSEAERQGLVSRNVARLVRVPSPPRKEVSPLSPEQARAFLQAVEGDRLAALYKLGMALGLRQGELLGLQWDAVDLDGGALVVKRSLRRHGGAYHLDEPKTERSRRALPLPSPLVDALRAHRDRQAFERIIATPWLGDDWNLVFARPDGYPLSGPVVTKQFQRHLERAGLPRVRFHDLRHGAATYLLHAGVPMRSVMDLLGHTQMSTTSDLYSHVLPDMQREASEKVAAVLFG